MCLPVPLCWRRTTFGLWHCLLAHCITQLLPPRLACLPHACPLQHHAIFPVRLPFYHPPTRHDVCRALPRRTAMPAALCPSAFTSGFCTTYACLLGSTSSFCFGAYAYIRTHTSGGCRALPQRSHHHTAYQHTMPTGLWDWLSALLPNPACMCRASRS